MSHGYQRDFSSVFPSNNKDNVIKSMVMKEVIDVQYKIKEVENDSKEIKNKIYKVESKIEGIEKKLKEVNGDTVKENELNQLYLQLNSQLSGLQNHLSG